MVNQKGFSRLGIWGYGVAGKSVAAYIIKQKIAQITVLDSRALTPEEHRFLSTHGVRVLPAHDLQQFLAEAEYVFPSPGIDLRPYAQYAHKWLSEIDLFALAWKKPVLAITGTAGKTSLTTMLSSLLSTYGYRIATGGNIGTGLLDLVEKEEETDYAVLELSSYQLERSAYLAPDLAIITNLYPNHLDRHGSFAEYCAAKFKLLAYQKKGQCALIPFDFASEIETFLGGWHQQPLFFSNTVPANYQDRLGADDHLYAFDAEKNIVECSQTGVKRLVPCAQVPALSYPSNWLIIVAALRALGIDYHAALTAHLSLPEHRGELVATIGGVRYYNDSKSTLFEATLAAVERLQGAPLILMLGGVSKGVDRLIRIKELVGKVSAVVCFGAEAQPLADACRQAGIQAVQAATLETACAQATQLASMSDNCAVLFSPAGASFDLFANYQERGEKFVALVKALE